MKKLGILAALLSLLGLLFLQSSAAASPVMQQATAVATVTGTPEGPVVLVPSDFVNVRTGPGLEYDKVGVLVQGQTAPAIGRSVGGDWVQIRYPGVEGNVAWVYSGFIRVIGTGLLPTVVPPPTPTPQMTATINPTLAAQFNLLNVTPTRLPTFTPAAPVVQPTFPSSQSGGPSGFPPVIAILGLLVLGLFGTMISFLRG